MDKSDSIPPLVQRLRDGDPQAAEDLFERYAERLVRLADQHLSRKVAGRVDGEDVVQSVFRTFFRRSAGGDFRIESSAQTWRLLVSPARPCTAHSTCFSTGWLATSMAPADNLGAAAVRDTEEKPAGCDSGAGTGIGPV